MGKPSVGKAGGFFYWYLLQSLYFYHMEAIEREHRKRMYRYVFGAQYGKVLRQEMARRGVAVDQQAFYNAIHHGTGRYCEEIWQLCEEIYRSRKAMESAV